jgi:7-cyano-7-deazaguanine synthase
MRTIVLCSGGLKSAFLAQLAAKEGEVVLFYIDHAHPSRTREIQSCHALTSALTSQGYKVSLRIEELSLPIFWIPFKLSLMLFLGIIRAQEEGCAQVYYGASKDDPMLESSATYLTSLRRLCDVGQLTYDPFTDIQLPKLEAEAPLALLDMKRVLRLGSERGFQAPWGVTWSCEGGDALHCGECFHCRRRRNAFKAAGLEDPTLYADNL